jgi:glycosyltransferase involved in cell wall biosynthesis
LAEEHFKLFNAIKSEMDRFHFTGPVIRFIHDNDDLLIDVPEYNTNAETYKKNKEKIIKQLEYFNEFTVSTDFLKSKTPIKSYDKITVIPNLINLDYYQPYAKSINDILPDFSKEFVVSYHGGSSHNGDIQCIEDVFTQIYKWNNIKFAFFGFVPQILRDINRDKIYYQPPINISYNRYPYVLSGEGKIRKDIALLPLVENDFNKAKSNLKLMEYSALGIPCICSDFDGCPFSDAPIKIPNNDTTAWIEEIKRLMNDTEYYKKQVELALLYAKKYDINGDKSKALKELILS